MSVAAQDHSRSSAHLLWTVLIAICCVAGSLASIWLSVGMNLKACPLCLYQRTFLLSATAVLLLGLTTEFRSSRALPLLALPLITGGLGVAAFHEYLELTGKLECPKGIFDLGTAPQQSLALFIIVLLLLLISLLRGDGANSLRIISGLILGLLLAGATIKSAPPMPPTPTKAYDQPLDVCRPPYRAPVAWRSNSHHTDGVACKSTFSPQPATTHQATGRLMLEAHRCTCEIRC